MNIDEFVDIVVTRLSFEVSDRNPYELFNDLAIDSLRVLEILLVVESLAGLDFPPDDVPMMTNFADAFSYYHQCVLAREH